MANAFQTCPQHALFLTTATTLPKAGGQLAIVTFSKEETQHVFFDQLHALRVSRTEPVLIDNGGQTFEPLFPTLLGDVVEYSLAQFTGMRRLLHAFRFPF